METNELTIIREDGIATITLNRPDRLNALTIPMVKELCRIVEDARLDDSIKVLIITGTGRGFCSGADIALVLEGREKIERTRRELTAPVGFEFLSLTRCEKPMIAAINGVAAGGGLTIALACDIRIASERARFTAAWIRRGMSPEDGVTCYLPRLLGVAKALELMFTGDMVDAVEAERIGLVNRVVPHDRLMTEANELASRIAKGPSIAIELTKMLAYKGLRNDIESQLAIENFARSIFLRTEDYKEGLESFKQKRQPEFKGR